MGRRFASSRTGASDFHRAIRATSATVREGAREAGTIRRHMNAPREVANSAAGWQWLGLAILALVATAQAQQSRPLPPALEPFVSVNASSVALTHVNLVDVPARRRVPIRR